MRNWMKRFLERRWEKKHQRESLQTLRTWGWLEKVFESGMLSFDTEHHRLFITQPMAVLMMANGADGWVNSVREIYQYVHWRQTQRAWEEYIRGEELTAVRAALHRNHGEDRGHRGDNEGGAQSDSSLFTLHSSLNRDDIERIKRARRMEIAQGDMEPPKVEGFEFFILPDSTAAAVEPIAVGYFDPETEGMEIAQWSEVKALLKNGKGEG